jgi:hypothetical protein
MDFETGPRAAELTSPAIAAQHFVADLFVQIGLNPRSRLLWSQLIPNTPKTARQVSCFRSFNRNSTMIDVVQKCGVPDHRSISVGNLNCTRTVVSFAAQ